MSDEATEEDKGARESAMERPQKWADEQEKREERLQISVEKSRKELIES